MNVCFFGTYDRGHSANRLLAQAVEASGADLEELHEPLWEAQQTKGRGYFGARSLATLGRRYVMAARGLARAWRARSPGSACIAVPLTTICEPKSSTPP